MVQSPSENDNRVFRVVSDRSIMLSRRRPLACRQTPVFRHHSETTDRSRFAALNPLQCEHTALGSIRQRPIGVDLIQMAAGDTTACSAPNSVVVDPTHRAAPFQTPQGKRLCATNCIQCCPTNSQSPAALAWRTHPYPILNAEGGADVTQLLSGVSNIETKRIKQRDSSTNICFVINTWCLVF